MIKQRLLTFIFVFFTTNVVADGPLCPDAEIFGKKMFTGICWSCILPMTLFGKIDLGNGRQPPGADDDPVCWCDDDLGVPQPGVNAAMWSVNKIIEVTKTPFCSPTLHGTIIGGNGNISNTSIMDTFDIGGQRYNAKDATNIARYQVHALEFPLFALLGFVTTISCISDGITTIDWALPPTEFLPNWNDEELGFLLAAESLLFANPAAQMAQAIDCPASSFGYPMNSLYWVAGCWGFNYPMTGNVVDPISGVQTTSLLTSRYLQYNHRLGVLKKTYGTAAMCEGGSPAFSIVKDQYKLSMIYPVEEASGEGIYGTGQTSPPGADTGNSGNCCHNVGAHTMQWGLGRDMPGPGEHHVYTLFKYKQCCIPGV